MPAYNFPLLIKQLLVTPLAHNSTSEIVYRGSRYGYRELSERIGRLGSALSGLGVKRGDTVAVMDWDTNRYLECYFAVPMLGAVLETVNVRLSREQLVFCLNNAEATVLIANTEFLPIVEAIRPELTTVKKIVWASDAGPLPAEIAGEGEYEHVISRGDPAHAFPDFDENTRATIFYTTGTTGLPKGVTFTHRQLVLHTLAALSTFGLTYTSVYMPMTPMFHVHAWGLPFVATLAGCKQVYPGRYVPDALLGLIRDEHVTFTHCVPTILQMLLAAPSSAKTDLNGLRMVVGGSALPRALCEAALARGIDAFTGYGMSETCPLLAVAAVHPQTPRDEEHEISTRMKAGHALPLVDLRVVDFEMNDVAHDGVATGEIVARAPWLTQVYYKNPAATDVLWSGGYLHTQDIGTIDAEGNVEITDRLKDVIKTGGEWVSSLELESIIGNHADIAEVAVIGLPDPKWGERPVAIVVAREGKTVHAADIKERVRLLAETGVVPKYAVPAHVYFLAELPKTSVGKLDKKVLRQVFSAVSFVEA